jgi:dTDP-4-dehydrorhamnose reductase
LTSERFLHSRVEAFPEEFAGGNGRDRYADVEAIRMPLPRKQTGPEARLREVWDRYNLPMAVTEAHHGSTREEQLRWLIEVWNAATRLRRNGVDIRAVTSWALFGAVDWNSLLTRSSGFYEPGAFDIRNSPPRLTVIGRAARSLARQGKFDHPAIEQPGWWGRPERFYRPRSGRNHLAGWRLRRHLVIAADDTELAQVFEAAVRIRGLDYIRVSKAQLDGFDPNDLAAMLSGRRPWAFIDARANPASVREFDRDRLRTACSMLELPLAMLSGEKNRPLVHLAPSRDGARPVPEPDGWSELERRVLMAYQQTLIVRAGPTSVDALLDLLIDGERGLWQATKALSFETDSPSRRVQAKTEMEGNLSSPL